MSDIQHSELLRLLRYNRKTGVFTLRVDYGKRFAGEVIGKPNARGYLRAYLFGKMRYLHRVAFFYVKKRWPVGQLDHRDGVYGNNIFCNLREANAIQNGRNRKLGCNSTTGVKGVCFIRKQGTFRADIKLPNRRLILGTFATLDEARAARQAAEIKHFAEWRRADA